MKVDYKIAFTLEEMMNEVYNKDLIIKQLKENELKNRKPLLYSRLTDARSERSIVYSDCKDLS